MKVIESAMEMQALAIKERNKSKKITFVPTMGYLHEGHLSLLREARKHGNQLVLSIFVNPTQFGPNEDLDKYPRDTKGDLEKAKSCGTDVVFFPTPEIMYPKNYQTYVTVEGVSQGLCGASRPTHFRGVATVVLKLFNIVLPHISFFGEKDYQQLQVIKQMVNDLNVPVEVVGLSTVREADGLAMSSRNKYLSPEERKAALSLSLSLKRAREAIAGGEKNVEKLKMLVRETITSTKIPRIDYVEICDSKTLQSLNELKLNARLIIAAFVGKTRLIDNCQL